MKLVTHSGESWCFQLDQYEARHLRGLLKKFPISPAVRPELSKSDDGPGAAEREKMLKESLAGHRKQLKRLALDLLGETNWQPSPEGHLLTLTCESREILLQILNDIRLGCWQALGEPEDLDEPVPSLQMAGPRALMDLAGYFEMNLLDPEIMI